MIYQQQKVLGLISQAQSGHCSVRSAPELLSSAYTTIRYELQLKRLVSLVSLIRLPHNW